MPPSEYFKRNCWVSVEADEVTVPHFVETFGDERLIFSTDSHTGTRNIPTPWTHSTSCRQSDESRARIVSTNWSTLYDIPLVKKT